MRLAELGRIRRLLERSVEEEAAARCATAYEQAVGAGSAKAALEGELLLEESKAVREEIKLRIGVQTQLLAIGLPVVGVLVTILVTVFATKPEGAQLFKSVLPFLLVGGSWIAQFLL